MKPALPQSALLPVLLQDVLVVNGRTWMRASALARHLGQPIDLVRRQIDQLRRGMSGRWWLRNVQPEGLDVRLSRDGVAVLPMEGVPGMRLKALCMAAFDEAERLRLLLADQQAGLGQALDQPDVEPAPVGWAAPGAAPAGAGWSAAAGADESGAAPATRPAPGQPMPVPFRGATLYVVEHEGEPYVPMRPVVEGMGLDWKSQYRRLTDANGRFSVVMMTTQMPGDDQHREVVCLPLRKVAGWLMTIEVQRVRPELRDKILAYQNECDDVLWRYWTEGRVGRSASFRAADQQEEAPRAGPFVLDDAFVARVYVALGRKAVQTEVLRRLLLMGALENWVCVSAREIARLHPHISSSAAHKAAHLLKARGILAMEDGGPYRPWRYRVLEEAVRGLIDATEGLSLGHMENVLTGALKEEITKLPEDKRRKLH